MHPTDHYETLRRGREELLRRAEYERKARKAKIEQGMNRNMLKVANWLGMQLLLLSTNQHSSHSFLRSRSLLF